MIQWHTQVGKINTNLRVKIDFTLSELSTIQTVMWNYYVDESSKVRYDTILGRDILTALGLNLKFSYHAIESDDEIFIGSTASMVEMGVYEFKYLNKGKITPAESFMNSYVEEEH